MNMVIGDSGYVMSIHDRAEESVSMLSEVMSQICLPPYRVLQLLAYR